MSIKKRMKQIQYAMLATVLLVGSPIVIMANTIEPRVFGLPFFLFWNFLPATVLFVLSIWYSKLADKLEEQEESEEG